MSQSIVRYEQRSDKIASESMNILSFDSPAFKNGIVSAIFAAELEKLTHRPILHMFDLICGKNESSFVAGALAIHKDTSKVMHYEGSFRPEFRASELLPGYRTVVTRLGDSLPLKKRFKEFYLKDLITQLAIVKDTECFSTFKNNKILFDVCSLVLEAVPTPTNARSTNPFMTVLKDLAEWPTYKSLSQINLVSFGTGVSYKNQSVEADFLDNLPKTVKPSRWQIVFDDCFDLATRPEIFYWDHARIFLEEKWIEDTKSMRDLVDRLEDRPYLPKLLGWGQER